MTKFTVVGSLNYDLVSYTERIPNAGETFQSESFATHIGGKGLNQGIALAKLFPSKEVKNVRFIGKVGDDSFGSELLEALKRFEIDVSNVEIVSGERSGVAVIIVEKTNGENRILINPGANHLTNYSFDELSLLFPDGDSDNEVVVFQNEVPATLETIKWLATLRPAKTIIYNPSPYYTYSASIISSVDILIANEGESLSIAKDILVPEDVAQFESSIEKNYISGYQQLAEKLRVKLNLKKKGATNGPIVVITLGSYGCVYASDDTDYIEPRKVAKVIDTTGAGDTFTGAFLVKLLSSLTFGRSSVRESIDFATLAASLAIQKEGASSSIPTFEEVVKAQVE